MKHTVIHWDVMYNYKCYWEVSHDNNTSDGLNDVDTLKPMYSFGKWWKWKISLMGFVYMSSKSPVNGFVWKHKFSEKIA